MFVAKNKDLFKANIDFHSISTRHNNDLHLPSAQLKLFQKGVFFSGIKAYSHLPVNIKELSYHVK
jgi:ribosomal protein S12 methylthiotransferase accessory factor YcaO